MNYPEIVAKMHARKWLLTSVIIEAEELLPIVLIIYRTPRGEIYVISVQQMKISLF